MSKNKNLFLRFWQELKRRKVFKVIAMYAGTAFVIVQVVDILTNRLNLPPWIASLAIILLSAGFPVVAVSAWIFDLTPEGIKKTESLEESKRKEKVKAPVRRRLKASDIAIGVLAVAVIILAYPKIFKRDTLETLRSKGKISVAVMPFQNMTNDTTWNVWQDGIQNELISSLTNTEELKVRQTESTKNLLLGKGLTSYASITPSVAGNISQKLETDVFVYGSIKEAGKSIRVNAQLIDSKTGDIFASFQIDGIPDNIIPLIDSLSADVKKFLLISVLQKTFPYVQHAITNSPEALKYYIYGINAGSKFDWKTAREWLSKATAEDSNFIPARIALATTYSNWMYNPDVDVDKQKKLMLELYKKRDLMSRIDKLTVELVYAQLFQTPVEQIKYSRQLLEIDDQQPDFWELLGYLYFQMSQYDKAATYFEKEFEVYKKWGIKPKWVWNYTNFGDFYHKTGQYRKEKRLYKKAERDFPDNPEIINKQAILALSTGNTKDANKYIEELKSVWKSNLTSDADIAEYLGLIYWFGSVTDKAEEYLRQALELEPENHWKLNAIGWFLIDKNLNINEGLELIDKALKISPDSFWLIENKGMGLYKQGKYKEALDLLQKSWDLRMKNEFYNHEAFLNLEAAKKAVAEQK